MPHRVTYLNAALRRTSDEASAVFIEDKPLIKGHASTLRAIRCYQKDTVQAALDTCQGFKATTLPEGQNDGDSLPLLGIDFYWNLRRKTWKFDGQFYSIEIMTSCCREDAEAWLQAFKSAEAQSPTLHHGKQRIEHLLGVTPDAKDRVADSNTDNGEITWYLLSESSRLFATSLADATAASPTPILVPRMIHHEAAHCYEPSMRDWLHALTPTVTKVNPANLDKLAHALNPAYLPSRIEAWKDDCTALAPKNPPDKGKRKKILNESLAAEFLVEAFLHVVIEHKPWPKGLWPVMDAFIKDMPKRTLDNQPSLHPSKAHQPRKLNTIRVMHAPKTILVNEEEPTDVSVSI